VSVFALVFSSRRRHTRSKRDWSSDVCSSDLMYYVTREVLPKMIEQESGDIINISSTAGEKGGPVTSAYSASKFGILGLTESLAKIGRASCRERWSGRW